MTSLAGFHIVGLIVILCGLLGIWFIVGSDLSKGLKLPLLGRIVFGIALGSGVFAFMLKYFIFITVEESTKRRAAEFHKRFLAEQNYSIPPTTAIKTNPNLRGANWQSLAQPVANLKTNISAAELGKELFYDKALSINGEVSCATCHDIVKFGGTDGKPTATGVFGQIGPRNSPSVKNAAFMKTQFWDGRAKSLEEQAKGPMTNPIEMGKQSLGDVVSRLKQDEYYAKAFNQVYGKTGITETNLLNAIATYERTLITSDTPYDKYVAGDLKALSPQQIKGMKKFYSIGCKNCHDGPDFSRAGVNSLYNGSDGLRIFPVYTSNYSRQYDLIEKNSKSRTFRIPSLRNITETAPYFHNGKVNNLEEAVKIMAVSQLGMATKNVTPDCINNNSFSTCNKPKYLSDDDAKDIVEFLKSLSQEKNKN